MVGLIKACIRFEAGSQNRLTRPFESSYATPEAFVSFVAAQKNPHVEYELWRWPESDKPQFPYRRPIASLRMRKIRLANSLEPKWLEANAVHS